MCVCISVVCTYLHFTYPFFFQEFNDALSYTQVLIAEPFNLVEELPIRVHLIPLKPATTPDVDAAANGNDADDEQFIFVVVIHKIAIDEWSSRILVDDLCALIRDGDVSKVSFFFP